MNKHVANRLSLSLALTAIMTTSAFAQVAPGVGAQTNPGLQTTTPTQQQIQDSAKKIQQQAQPQQELNVPNQPTVVQVEQAKFMVNKIMVDDSTLLTPAEVSGITQAYEGKEATLEDLEKVVEAINDKYREKGFLTTQAYVPPQDVNEGTVHIKVAEGRVGKVCLTGNRFYRDHIVMNQVRLKEGELFNLKQLEQDLNNANQQYNFRLKATLAPGEATGTTDVRIEVAERQPWQITPTFDNQGRPLIGTMRWGTEVSNDSLLGFGDRLLLKYIGAAGTQVGLGSYSVPVSRRGDEITLSYGYSHIGLDQDQIDGFDKITGKASNWSLLFSHPFDSRRYWVGDIGVNARNVHSIAAITGVGTAYDSDRVRSIQAGINFNRPDSLGRTFARLQSTWGVDAFGSNTDFWKMEGFLTRLFRLPKDNLLILRAYGQYSPDALPTVEAFQLGGAYSVRGYTEGLLVGDSGFNFNIEDRFPIPFLRNVSPWLADRLQGAVFYDIGYTDVNDDNPRLLTTNFLTSAGVGLRARMSRLLEGFVDFGFGLAGNTPEPNAQPTARIHFGLRSNLLPETYKARSNNPSCQRKAAAEAPAEEENQTAEPAVN